MLDFPPTRYSFRDVVANRPLLLALSAVVLGLCLLFIFAILLLRGDNVIDGGDEPTPFPDTVADSERDIIVAGLTGSTAISLSLNAPNSMQIGTQTFNVRAEPVQEDGRWEPELEESGSAAWVYGSLINYIIGLPSRDDNQELLENLAPGDEVIVTLRDGTQHHFAVTNREYVAVDRGDIFAQNMPGLTLVLVRARGDERLVVQADYVVDPTASGGNNGTADNMVELGETAQLGNLRLTVTDAAALFNEPGAPPGFIFYLVNFQIQNVGTEPLDLSQLRFALNDELGNQYAMSPQAAQRGNAQPPTGVLAAGESRQATVGYQIPAGLSSPTLIWLVSREGGTGQVQVTIPFAESSEAAAQNATVNLQSAEVSADGTSLVLAGQITNNGTEALIVNETSVSLMSNGTVHLMLSTNPAFPWAVAPGQTASFSVSFQRPMGAEAVFTILSYPFRLTGLR